MDFKKITHLITYNEFEAIKEFILKNGNRVLFRNYDNNNPHYKLKNCDLFLGADIGQKNINNNPNISDFNELIIADRSSNAAIQYYKIIIVRKGDLKKEKTHLVKAMKEEQVYLIDTSKKGLLLMEEKLPIYLKEIQKEVNLNTRY